MADVIQTMQSHSWANILTNGTRCYVNWLWVNFSKCGWCLASYQLQPKITVHVEWFQLRWYYCKYWQSTYYWQHSRNLVSLHITKMKIPAVPHVTGNSVAQEILLQWQYFLGNSITLLQQEILFKVSVPWSTVYVKIWVQKSWKCLLLK